jgi:hypothetical protein
LQVFDFWHITFSKLLFKSSNGIVKFEGTIIGGIKPCISQLLNNPTKLQVEHENRLQHQEESIPKAQV